MIKNTATLLLTLFFFSNYSLAQKNNVAAPPFKISATYTPYSTALGKGKGIIFRVNINSAKSFTVDSFYVNSKPMLFIFTPTSKGVMVEANYLKNKSEPVLKKDETTSAELGEITDEIIVKKKFYPSWLVVTQSGKQWKCTVEKFNFIASKEH
ncbi:MAG: hypothetical protein ACHQK8_05980 [Bacteroidia bacterium]